MKQNRLSLVFAASLLLAVLTTGIDSQAQGRNGKGMRGNQGCNAGQTGCQMNCANAGICNATGTGFIDANNDGVCDNRGMKQGMNRGKQGNGMGFVDKDNDGINDNSPLSKIALTAEQKTKIAALRQSGKGPHIDALKSILTEQQLTQLEILRAERQAQNQGKRPGKGQNGRGPRAK